MLWLLFFFYLVLGEWGVICDDMFDLREANVICRELGFPNSVAVKSNSYFGVPNQTRFVLDDLNCNGNENSLYSCQFKEWGVHDCNAQEVSIFIIYYFFFFFNTIICSRIINIDLFCIK